MNAQEVQQFEADPLMHHVLQMRNWDDAAKIDNAKTPSPDTYRPMITDHLLLEILSSEAQSSI